VPLIRTNDLDVDGLGTPVLGRDGGNEQGGGKRSGEGSETHGRLKGLCVWVRLK
jgi:hypothetical protein